MADIIINGPEGQSTINNIPAWATAAGQVSVENVLKGMAKETTKTRTILEILARGGKLDKKNQKEVKKEIETLQKVFKNIDKKQEKRDKGSNKTLDDGLKHLQNLQSDGIDQLSKLNKNMTENDKNLDKILNNLNNGSSGLMSMAGGMSKGGFVLGAAIDAITAAAGLFGAVILTAANYVKNEFLDVFKFYNQALSAGTGGIIGLTHPVENVARAANLAGMSLEEFGEFAQSNSKILRTLTTTGFTELYSKSLIASNGLLELGMTSEDALGSMMAELEFRRRFGMVIQNQGNNLQSSFTESVRMIRRFAQAAGMSEQELRDGSEVQEDYVDQLRAIGIRLGASGEDIADSTRMISTELKAYGLEDLTNPLFEAISRGSAGLSQESMNLIQSFPGLYESIERLANDFQTTGQLPKRAGRELAELLRDLTPEQLAYSSSLFTAGVDGAAAIQNLSKNITKLSDEQFEKFMEELDTSRFSMMTTFNKLGFIVNQATATIGDFGKTVLMSALGFDKMSDNTFDFNESIRSVSQGLTDFVGNVFGRETGIYHAMENFQTYMDTMFGGQRADESKEEFEKRLDEARTAFVKNISDFAIKLGDQLNEELQNQTLAKSIGRFFRDLMDDMAISINDATGGMLFSDKVAGIRARQFAEGTITGQAYMDSVGYSSRFGAGNESKILTSQVIRDPMMAELLDTKTNSYVSSLAGTNADASTDIFNSKQVVDQGIIKDFSLFPTFMNQIAQSEQQYDRNFKRDYNRLFEKDAYGNKTVIKDDLSEADQRRAQEIKEKMQQNFDLTRDINTRVQEYLEDIRKTAETQGIDIKNIEDLEKIGDGYHSALHVLKDIKIDPSIINDSATSEQIYRLQEFIGAVNGISAPELINRDQVYTNQRTSELLDSYKKQANELAITPVIGFRGNESVVYEHPEQLNNRTAQTDLTKIQELLVESMADSRMTYEEKNELGALLKEFNKNYKNLNEQDKELKEKIDKLVEESARQTNELSKTNAHLGSDATSGG